MKKWLLFSIIAVLFIVSTSTGIAFASKSSELAEANISIVSLESQIISLKNEVVSLQSTKTSLESKIESMNTALSQRQTELNITKQQLDSAGIKIISLESSLSTAQGNYQSTSRELSELKSFYDGIFKGKPPPYLKPNGQVMKIVDNPVSKDPTWQQLVTFLANDLTDRTEYILGKYVCSNFSEDVHNNAEAKGIRSAIVGLDFENSSVGHALNAFNTVDRSLSHKGLLKTKMGDIALSPRVGMTSVWEI